MNSEIIYLHRAAPAKPTVGQPCNGCGVCCALVTCPVARLRYWRAAGPCPALAWSSAEQRYRCGLLSEAARYRWLPPALASFARRCLRRWIAAGKGCDCTAEVQP